MGHKRLIDSKIRSSQTFAQFTYRQRDLWHGLIVTADDQGRMPGAIPFIRSSIFPYDDVTISDVDLDLQKLIDAENIKIYHVDDCVYLQIINWWKHQKMQWASPSDYPPPEGWLDRCRYHAGQKVVTVNWETEGGFKDNIKDSVNDEDYMRIKGTSDTYLGGVPTSNNSSSLIFKHYETEIGIITPTISEEIISLIDEGVNSQWFLDAIRIAAEQNKRSWAYVKAILKRWIAQGSQNDNRKGNSNNSQSEEEYLQDVGKRLFGHATE